MPAMRYVVLARQPAPGQAKTRLMGAPLMDETAPGAAAPRGLGPVAAAAVAEALLRCTLARLAARGPMAEVSVVLAATPDGSGRAILASLGLDAARFDVLDQGPGDLGDRLARLWTALGSGPTAFLGADTPDLPDAHLDAIGPALRQFDAAIGPTEDGGYWTLAAAEPRPALLDRIDWGSAFVYDQTGQRAAEAGLTLATLPSWGDVDRVEDLRALLKRLEAASRSGHACSALAQLRADLVSAMTLDAR